MLFCNFDFKLILNCQRQLKKKASYKHRMTVCHSQRFTRLDFQKFSPLAVSKGSKLQIYNDSDYHSHRFTRPLFQKKCLRRLKRKQVINIANYKHRMTLTAKNFRLRWFQKEASYKHKITLTVIRSTMTQDRLNNLAKTFGLF